MNDDSLTNPDRGCAPKNGVYNLQFTSDHLSDQIAARAICNACPVRRECLRYAVDNDERHHMWAGYLMSSELERRHARQGSTPTRSQTAAHVRQLWEQGLTDGRIAGRIGVDPSTVRAHRVRQDLPPNTAGPGRPRKTAQVAA